MVSKVATLMERKGKGLDRCIEQKEAQTVDARLAEPGVPPTVDILQNFCSLDDTGIVLFIFKCFTRGDGEPGQLQDRPFCPLTENHDTSSFVIPRTSTAFANICRKHDEYWRCAQ